jgi:hypothetical protein
VGFKAASSRWLVQNRDVGHPLSCWMEGDEIWTRLPLEEVDGVGEVGDADVGG